jgi:dihydrofolate synthase / folylpolyglutamate synthase
MNCQTLAQWLYWLENQLIKRTAYRALGDVKQVAAALDLLPFNTKIITVGGTNGKGSCVALLESIYNAAAYKVGTFTSPHLFKFNERIRVNKKNIADEEICAAFVEINKARGQVELNYFQFSFLAALLIFKKLELDVVILEVGIGGRYDAVNIVDSALAIISSIELDHCEVLGNTREIIGKDKAGIMRRLRPVVCGDANPPNSIFVEAEKIGARLICLKRDFSYQEKNAVWSLQFGEEKIENLPLPQQLLNNAATVIVAICCMQNLLPVSYEQISDGLRSAKFLGRCQVIQHEGKTLLFDVAHNPAAAKVLAQKINSLKCTGKKYAIVGMLGNKDIACTLAGLYDDIDYWQVTLVNDSRSAKTEQFRTIFSQLGSKSVSFGVDSVSVFDDTYKKVLVGDLLVVFGSFITVANIVEGVLWIKNYCKD